MLGVSQSSFCANERRRDSIDNSSWRRARRVERANLEMPEKIRSAEEDCLLSDKTLSRSSCVRSELSQGQEAIQKDARGYQTDSNPIANESTTQTEDDCG